MGKFKNDTIFAEDAFVPEDELDLDGVAGRSAHQRDYFDTFPPPDELDVALAGDPEPMTGEDLIALQLIAIRTQLVGLEVEIERELRIPSRDPEVALERVHGSLKSIIRNYC